MRQKNEHIPFPHHHVPISRKKTHIRHKKTPTAKDEKQPKTKIILPPTAINSVNSRRYLQTDEFAICPKSQLSYFRKS